MKFTKYISQTNKVQENLFSPNSNIVTVKFNKPVCVCQTTIDCINWNKCPDWFHRVCRLASSFTTQKQQIKISVEKYCNEKKSQSCSKKDTIISTTANCCLILFFLSQNAPDKSQTKCFKGLKYSWQLGLLSLAKKLAVNSMYLPLDSSDSDSCAQSLLSFFIVSFLPFRFHLGRRTTLSSLRLAGWLLPQCPAAWTTLCRMQQKTFQNGFEHLMSAKKSRHHRRICPWSGWTLRIPDNLGLIFETVISNLNFSNVQRQNRVEWIPKNGNFLGGDFFIRKLEKKEC